MTLLPCTSKWIHLKNYLMTESKTFSHNSEVFPSSVVTTTSFFIVIFRFQRTQPLLVRSVSQLAGGGDKQSAAFTAAAEIATPHPCKTLHELSIRKRGSFHEWEGPVPGQPLPSPRPPHTLFLSRAYEAGRTDKSRIKGYQRHAVVPPDWCR